MRYLLWFGYDDCGDWEEWFVDRFPTFEAVDAWVQKNWAKVGAERCWVWSIDPGVQLEERYWNAPNMTNPGWEDWQKVQRYEPDLD